MPTYLGYDPGGNGSHGVAALSLEEGRPSRIEAFTAEDGQKALDWLTENCVNPPGAIGIDTLLSWELSRSGWREADLALRRHYPEVKNSVASPNSLYGAMCIQGPATALSLRARWPDMGVTETHPKVLYFALTGRKYDWSNSRTMIDWLGLEIGLNELDIDTEHEWDAVISALCAMRGFTGEWKNDLLDLARSSVFPVPRTRYFWPRQL